MRAFKSLLSMTVACFAFVDIAHAEQYDVVFSVVAEKSRNGCSQTATYKFDLTGSTLTVNNVGGRMFTVTVPPDGMIKQAFRSPTGNNLEIVGNVKTGQLQLINSAYPCIWNAALRK